MSGQIARTMKNQLTRGLPRQLMYVENKEGDVDGVAARIGWVEFSKTGKTVYYRGRPPLEAWAAKSPFRLRQVRGLFAGQSSLCGIG